MTMRLLLALLTLTLAAGCTSESPAQGCKADPQCPSGSRCTAGVCSGDTRPTATIAALGPVEEYALVKLDGSGSSDPDGDVAEHRWTIRAVEAPCAPPEIAGADPVAQVRFGCSGRYEVTLVVRDALGGVSDPARVEVTVQPSTATPVVRAGADLATDHSCTGNPLRCLPDAVVTLAADAADGVTLRWTVQPPAERPLAAHRRVTFSPSAADRTPTVEIVTDGTAISGDWVFRVEAVDAHGVVGAAHTRVSVRNRAPVITHTPAGPFPHAFDAGRSVFTSQGAVAWRVEDPDGDPVEEVSGIWRHVGDGDQSRFDGDFDGTSVTFTVAVPYALPADGLKLRGGEGLVRQIELFATDANRTVGNGTIPIAIGNRRPVPAGGTFDTDVAHHFDVQRSRYVAFVRAGTFVDPDGDPIVDSTGPGLCGTLHASGNDVTVECGLAFEGVPIVDQLAGQRTFSVPARDPWDAALEVPLRTVSIRNSPPSVTLGTIPRSVCFWSRFGGLNCGLDVTVAAVEYDLTVDVSDPDGDPVLVRGATTPGGTVTPAGMVLQGPGTIPFHFNQAHITYHCYRGTEPLPSTLTATDGPPAAALNATPPLTRC